MIIHSEEALAKAYEMFEKVKFDQAREILETLLEDDLDNKEVIFAISCTSFWQDYFRRQSTVSDCYEKSENILIEWKAFRAFLLRKKNVFDSTIYAINRGIFSLALENYSKLTGCHDIEQKAEIYRKAGLCYKKLGEYETAKNSLQEANHLKSGTASVLAELADCFALCGDDRNAKVLFKESFFLEPEKIDLDFLDSELICCLIRQVKEKGYTGTMLQHWIPVYGVLLGIFNIKRELKTKEIMKLRQEIYAKENESKNPACDLSVLTPRLINLYFWLIDYYVQINDTGKKTADILLKIKILDRDIYNLYIK